MEATHTVPTPAHTSTAVVAPFRAWRGSQFRVARGPVQATIKTSPRWYQFRGAIALFFFTKLKLFLLLHPLITSNHYLQ